MWIKRHTKASGISQDKADEEAATPIDIEGYALAALRVGLAACNQS